MPSRNLYGEITDRIVAALEQGVAPWVCPWDRSGGRPHNGASGHVYRGINVLLLAMSGYGDARWFTFNQARDLGGHVRRGERGTRVVFWRFVERATEIDNGETPVRRIPIARSYTVFNTEQIEWPNPNPTQAPADPRVSAVEDDLADAHDLVAASGADIRHGGLRAYYSPKTDRIQVPDPARFATAGDYWATVLHELAHWTGHESRLDRDLSSRFGSDAYGAEELVAELAAAFLCADLSVPGKLQHEEYLGSWLSILRADTKAIFTAARLAQEAADYLTGKLACNESVPAAVAA